jgi:hypothetical protein
MLEIASLGDIAALGESVGIERTLAQGLIKIDPNAPDSRRYARYIPIWA